jgi:ADP-heptose:LPS heptosyltransferase
VPRDTAAIEAMVTYLKAIDRSSDFAVVNTGAGWYSRVWPAERYGAIASHLGEEHGLPTVVVWAGPSERAWAHETVELSGGHAVLAPPTSLGELAELLRQARLYIGSDTGPMHLASAVGTPCVALFGTTRPQISGPYGSQHVCVQEYYQAGTCRQRRKGANDAMRAIQVEAVRKACDRLLGRGPKDAIADRAA